MEKLEAGRGLADAKQAMMSLRKLVFEVGQIQ